jgi:Peptidase family M28
MRIKKSKVSFVLQTPRLSKISLLPKLTGSRAHTSTVRINRRLFGFIRGFPNLVGGGTAPLRVCKLGWIWAALLPLQQTGCERKSTPPQGRPVNMPAESTATTNPSTVRVAAAPTSRYPEIWKEFSGARAFAEVKKQVEIGPRPSGSVEITKARAWILDGLQREGWQTEEQSFTDQTPRGPMNFLNIIGRFSARAGEPPSRATQRAIVCSHYDTKRFSTIRFVGASDGASSTGALIELARVLALDPELAAKVELVFFDGEEALVQYTQTDGLHGSRYYARSLQTQNRARQFRFGILWDMIGDKDLTITLSPDSPQPLTQEILAAAEALGLRKHFGYFDRGIHDDQVPLNEAGVPTVDLIDYDYLPWHTADDTLDRLSPESLQKIGAVTLYHLRKSL